MIGDLNDVLISFNVYLNCFSKRKELVQALMQAGTTAQQLRTACEHMKRVTSKSSNAAAQIVTMINDDPQLRATLKAAGQYNRETAGPGALEREENMRHEQANPLAARQRLAMQAYCTLTHREVKDLDELAQRLGVSKEEATALVEEGKAIY